MSDEYRDVGASLLHQYWAGYTVTAEAMLASGVDVVPIAEEAVRRKLTAMCGVKLLASAARCWWEVEVWVWRGGGRRELQPWQRWHRGDLAPPRAYLFHCRATTPKALKVL